MGLYGSWNSGDMGNFWSDFIVEIKQATVKDLPAIGNGKCY